MSFNINIRDSKRFTVDDIGFGLIRGLYPGAFPVIQTGSVAGISANVRTVVWNGASSGDEPYPWQNSGFSLEVVSSSPLDVQVIEIDGLTVGQEFQNSGPLTLNGTTPVAVPGTWIGGVHGAKLLANNGLDINVGTIEIRLAGGGLVLGKILPTEGATQNAIFMVPLGLTLYIQAIFLSCIVMNLDSVVTLQIFKKDPGGTWQGLVPFSAGAQFIPFLIPFPVGPGSQVELRGLCNRNMATISVGFSGVLVPPGFDEF